MSDNPRWLSVSEAAELLDMSADSVRRRANDGEIVSRWTRPPQGGQRQYREDSVLAYRARMESGGTPDA